MPEQTEGCLAINMQKIGGFSWRKTVIQAKNGNLPFERRQIKRTGILQNGRAGTFLQNQLEEGEFAGEMEPADVRIGLDKHTLCSPMGDGGIAAQQKASMQYGVAMPAHHAQERLLPCALNTESHHPHLHTL